MKKIKVYFCDMWTNFDMNNNMIVDILKEKYDVSVVREVPDVIFFSCFGFEHLTYSCIRIFMTGESQVPDFNLCDYAIGYDYITFAGRYIRNPYWHWGEPLEKNLQEFSMLEHKKIDLDKNLTKRKFCNFVYSNANADSCRDTFFIKLCKYKDVESGGKHLNNIGYSINDKIQYISNFKFTIAFENSHYNGYTTEKLFDAYRARTIPIYWGNPSVALDFNEKSMIDLNNFNSIEEAIEEVIEIDKDEEKYLDMLEQKIFSEPNLMEKRLDELKNFLFGILEGKDVLTLKRNCSFHGKRYEQRQKELSESVTSKLIRFVKRNNNR